MNINIEPIAEAHIAGFHACLDAVAREKRYLAQFEAPPLARVSTFVHEGIVSNVSQFVALDGSTVIGWCDIFPDWAHATKHRGSVGMGVRSDYRHKGIGKRLLAACLSKAKKNGLTRIELEVRADNSPAIKLYEHLGFKQEALKRNALLFDGKFYDALHMSLIYEPGV
ncbi:MAG: GNAT family N-acetyltransferase [Bdellovibrionota bacterium]